MRFFVRRSDGTLLAFEGMTQQQIADMLTAQDFGYEFVDEATYESDLEALQ